MKKAELMVSAFKNMFHIPSVTQTLGFHLYCVF